jgi:hypothetical protein
MNYVLDEALSLELANRINSKSRAPFDNAFKAAVATSGSTYVQGFLVNAARPREPVEHAWIELPSDDPAAETRILDPNLPYLKGNPADLLYFAAHRLSVKQLKAAVEEAKEDYPDDDPLPIYGPMPYEYYGDVMLGGKDYLDAHNAAIARCRELGRKLADRN